MPFRSFLLSLIACLAIPAFATPQHKAATGMWFDPNESGWGLNLFHQGSTVFGALFVYGPDGQPRWYTASNMISSDDGPLHDHPANVSGDLFESTGPFYGGTFDPSKVATRKAGTISIDLGRNLSGVVYTIDGVTVQKNNIVPFTFRPDSIAGDYIGYRWQPAAGGPEVKDEVAIHVNDDGSTITMTTIGTDPSHPGCAYSGARTQIADFVGGSGSFTCSGSSGPWSMSVDVSRQGIMGVFNGNGITSPWGRIGASRTSVIEDQGSGAYNDLWFPPNESGWGINFLDQGDTAFATIFVYDAQGRSHWFVASNLHRAGPNADDDRFEYVGPLLESTGPYYGTAFNPSLVTRRVVGTLSFEPTLDKRSADVIYTVDGVQVVKRVSRFAFAKESLTGTYLGHIVSSALGSSPQPITMTIDDSNGFVMDTRSPGGVACHYTAPADQAGDLRRMDGTVSCSNGVDDHFTMDEVAVSWSGFMGSFSGNGVSVGNIEGVRTQMN